ncbi:3'(2'),5'-bisphosphate nucleotidase CysQ [Desertimonas flava]|jgi:3'(2'), 5'-bisphosphate nucleotidase|uniref:3'(2'),5'-bisphosphate nucleotidase CysQ n=1 Tax=Desertimonas flava TaxID=2064846 RepID=UPI000E34E3A9|nr:3'(2'),5'-bisphosphate nucleotidase CysQ [Desertimonas flava]
MSSPVPASDESDAQLATRLATETGHLLVDLRRRLIAARAPYWHVMDEGDAAAQRYLASELARTRPSDAVLSEEGAEDPRRLTQDRVWIVDPLDGTREYGEPGRNDWAVHVALWDRDHFAAGAVSLPAIERTLSTDPAPEVPMVKRATPVVVTSRSRTSYATVVVADALGANILQLGSAGAKAMAVVNGIADVYVHAGGMYQWDSAAPAAVALAAGLHVSRIDGSPIVYNDPDPWLPDFVVCRPAFAEPVLTAIDAAARH